MYFDVIWISKNFYMNVQTENNSNIFETRCHRITSKIILKLINVC